MTITEKVKAYINFEISTEDMCAYINNNTPDTFYTILKTLRAELHKAIDKSEAADESCIGCGAGNASYDVCPYDEDINGGTDKVWLCEDCRYERAQDI